MEPQHTTSTPTSIAIRYASGDTRRDAAQRAAHLWNIGKVLSSNPGD